LGLIGVLCLILIIFLNDSEVIDYEKQYHLILLGSESGKKSAFANILAGKEVFDENHFFSKDEPMVTFNNTLLYN